MRQPPDHYSLSRIARVVRAVAILTVVAAGCGKDGLPLVAIDGQITFDGKAPPKPGNIVFASVKPAPGLPSRPGDAAFGVDGKFTVTSFVDGDGLLPGTYQANVTCWRRPPTLQTVRSANLVPETFHPQVVIPADVEKFVLTLDVPIAGPSARAR